MFDRCYGEIKKNRNGLISLFRNGLWGIADHYGNIIVDLLYPNELFFDNGIAVINPDLRISLKGEVFVLDGDKEVMIPSDCYWGTKFCNNLSIIRLKSDRHKVGVMNNNGDVVIRPIYDSISLLSNGLIKIEDLDCRGLADDTGYIVFPSIFTRIEFVDSDRIRVVWNTRITSTWQSNGEDCLGYKRKEDTLDYMVCTRSALCNFKGEIISGKEYVLVHPFKNGFAPAYKRLYMAESKENASGVVVYDNGGVIDINGNTVLSPIYDKVVVYENQYAHVSKDGIWGVVNLKSREVTMFERTQIQCILEVDNYGRCVFSEEECVYDSEYNGWVGGNRGVVDKNGIIVKPGNYDRICLLPNGLIKVSVYKDDEVLCGLLNQNGEEILPLRYSFVSEFKGDYATICFEGKWGVIDKTGKFVKECVSIMEDMLEEVNDANKKDACLSFKEPSVIIFD